MAVAEVVERHRAQKLFVSDLFKQDEWSARQLAVEALQMFRFSGPGRAILADIGSGPGCSIDRLQAPVGGRTSAVICIDIHKDMLDAVVASNSRRVVCVQGDAGHLPLATACVDGALCAGVLHSVESQQRVLYELARIVKPGGYVSIVNKGLAPWLAESEWYRAAVVCISDQAMQWPPFHLLPPTAEDVRVQWLHSQAFYILSFRVGSGPELNLEAEVPGLGQAVGELLGARMLGAE